MPAAFDTTRLSCINDVRDTSDAANPTQQRQMQNKCVSSKVICNWPKEFFRSVKWFTDNTPLSNM